MNDAQAKRAVATLGVAAMALLTGCASSVSGSPQPGASASASPPAAANPFAAMNQCALLDELLAGQGFPKASPDVADPDHACGTSKPSSATTRGLDVGLNLQAGRGYKENITNPGKARTGDVNGRPAIEEPAPLGSPGQCSIAMSVEPGSRAIVDVSSGPDTAAACDTAKQLATQFEPKLPKS